MQRTFENLRSESEDAGPPHVTGWLRIRSVVHVLTKVPMSTGLASLRTDSSVGFDNIHWEDVYWYDLVTSH